MQPTQYTYLVTPWRAAVFLAVACVLLSAPPVYAGRDNTGTAQVTEFDLKAVYLYNFLHFVQWPDPQDGPRVIGIVGESPIGQPLADLQNRLIDSSKQEIQLRFYGAYDEGMDLSNCHLLYIAGSERHNFDTITASLRGSPVLTVADSSRFLHKGGMISFVKRKNKLRWSINRNSVQQAGLRLSAKLLDIAVEIIDGP